MKITTYLVLLLLAGYMCAHSADITVESSLDRNKGYIGDRIEYSLTIEADSSIKIDSLQILGDLGEFELRNWLLKSDRFRDGKRFMEYSGVLTVYETGKVAIPPVPIVFHPAEDVTDTIFTDSMEVFIMSLVLNDSAADIKDLKGVKGMGQSRAMIIIIIAVLLALAAALIWYFLKKRPDFEAQRTEPLKSPWDEALEMLASLSSRQLEPKAHYIELSDIIRRYVERRYGFSATDMTTSEIKIQIPRLNIDDDLSQSLMGLLEYADLVKFAKLVPSSERMAADHHIAKDFVKKTMPGAQVAEEVAP